MKRFPIGNVRNDFDKIVTLAKIASIVPIFDACLERGASAVKRIDSRQRSSTKNDFLNALIHISLNRAPQG